MEIYNDKQLPLPMFIGLNNIAGLVSIASANFYRTIDNSNVQIVIPIDTNTPPIFVSSDVYLPAFIFNKKNENAAIKYLNNTDVTIMQNVTCKHDILIQYKLTKDDNSNFANRREIKVTLVRADGTNYDDSIIADYQPDTGQHEIIILNGTITHAMNDIVKIKIKLVQDNKSNDQSNTTLTIFQVSWNVTILKNF